MHSYCGNVFCDLCTLQRSLIPEHQILSGSECKYLAVNAHNPQRVCDKCYARLEPQQEELRTSLSMAFRGFFLLVFGNRYVLYGYKRVGLWAVCAANRYHDEPRCASDGSKGGYLATTCE